MDAFELIPKERLKEKKSTLDFPFMPSNQQSREENTILRTSRIGIDDLEGFIEMGNFQAQALPFQTILNAFSKGPFLWQQSVTSEAWE